ncbi:MAG: bifunctional metallophosphatase/5'-nucleotidase [Candidatus Krumholzibacteriota bacterium]|nr:bifunctional metallophosphatase/5'-nucleotidase [Candidatus Krumholzibacteriota bacterium]
MSASKIRIVLSAGVAAGLLVTQQGCSGSEKPEKIPTGPTTELTILFSSDLLGKVRSCGCTLEEVGGLGRRTSYADHVRKSTENLLIVDAGDAFSLDLSYLKSEAELTFESFNIMGLDVFTPGELDFIFGLQFLQTLAENSSFDIVSANMVFTDTGEPLFGKRYVVKEFKGGIKVAVTGILDESVRFPGYIDKSMFRVDPAEKALKSVLPAMKREADFLILLSHMGIERTEDLLSRIADFDIAVVGHGKPLIKDQYLVGKTMMLATGGLGQYIGSISLELDKSGNYTEGLLSQVQLTSKKYQVDPRIEELFHLYELPLTDKEFHKKGKSTRN